MKRLHSPDPAEGAAPEAAEKVLKTPVEESDAGELVKTRRELENERTARKKEQIRLAELEDENRTLKTHLSPKPEEATKKGFLSGLMETIDDI